MPAGFREITQRGGGCVSALSIHHPRCSLDLLGFVLISGRLGVPRFPFSLVRVQENMQGAVCAYFLPRI